MQITEDLIELVGIILGDGGILYDEPIFRRSKRKKVINSII